MCSIVLTAASPFFSTVPLSVAETYVAIAGMVGISGHIQIADNTTIGAFSGVSKSISEPGQIYQGAVAIPIMKNKRSFAVYRNLPDLSKTVYELEKQIKELKEALNK